MRIPSRFRAETKYVEATEKKANVNLPMMARVGRGDAASTLRVAGRDNFYHIRLINDPHRLTQCFSPVVALAYDDYIYVAKASDRKLTYYEFVAFIETVGGVSSPLINARGIIIPDNLVQGFYIEDDDSVGAGTPEYLRIVTTDGGQALEWNFNNDDVNFIINANAIPSAFDLDGALGGITLAGPSVQVPDNWWLGLGGAAGRLVFDVTPAPDQVVLTAADLNMAGNDIIIPDAQADAMHVIDDTTAIEFQRFVTTAATQATVFNNGEADVDFRVAASGITNAFFVQGSDGFVGLGTAAPSEMLHLLSSVSTEPVLLLENTNADALAHVLEFYKNSAGPADNDDLGAIDFYGETSTGAKERYAYILSESLDVTNGDTGGSLRFQVVMDATERNLLEIKGYNGSVNEGEVVVNENGQDVDFRVEAAGAANALFVEGSTGYVGVGLASPQGHFHQFGAVSGLMHWEYNGLAGVAQTIIPNAAGDVTEMIYVQSVVTEVTGAGREGHTSWVEPGGSQIIYDDGVDTVTLSVAAAGNVTIVRTAGADTFRVSLWLMWI